jgi:uncharacterized protein
MKKIYILLLLFTISITFLKAQVNLITSPYLQDFVSLTNSGSSSSLPTGWLLNETGTGANLTYTAGTGSSNAGDTYSFGSAASTERAFGGLQSGSLVPVIGAGFTNNSGSAITSLTITYTGEQWRLGATGRQDRIDFQYSTNASSLITGTWTDENALDFSSPFTATVGALDGNASPNRTTNITSTITVNIPAGSTFYIRWTDFNASGADDGLSVDDFQLQFTTSGGGDPVAFISSSVNPQEPSTNGNFVISLNAAAASDITLNYTIGGTATAGTDYTTLSGTATITATNSTVTIPVAVINDADNDPGETIILTLQAGTGYILGSPISVTLTIADDDFTTTNLGTIQGTGLNATPGNFGIEAIVTAIYPNWSPAGFYIQESDATADADPLTSNGIYVVSTATVAVGDRVKIFGAVQEDNLAPSFRQAVITPSVVIVLSSGNALPAVSPITLPVTASVDELERFEGMLVQFPYSLTVTGNADLGRFGEVRLSTNGVVYQPTQLIDPNDNPASGTNSSGTSNVAAVTALQNQNLFRTILLDDGRDGIPTALPYIDANNTLRLGSSITNLTGVLGFGFSNYRVQPLPAGHPSGAVPSFTFATRPTGVPAVGAPSIKVVSFNIENFFNGDGAGGGFPTARGASSFAEYVRQRDKLVEALFLLNADVYGLVEVENDGTGATSAIAQLVDALNTRAGVAGLYAFIDDAAQPPFPTGDAIRSTIIYKTTVVTTVGAAMIDVDPVHNRAPTAQTFNVTAVNKTFSLVVVHHRAKSCSGSSTGANADQGDGQACNNSFRKDQTTALLNFLTTTVIPTSGTNRVIVVGDYNAYAEEDPIDMMRAAGYSISGTNTDVSYTFAGQQGSLDHAMLSPSLVGTLTGVGKWSINSSEPPYLGYEDNIQSGGETINPWSSTYTVSPWATSDHDPVVLGLLFSTTLPVEFGSFTVTKAGRSANINWNTIQEINSSYFSIERSNNSRNWKSIYTVAAAGNSSVPVHYNYVDENPEKGTNYYRIRQVDISNEQKTTGTQLVSFNSEKNISFFPNPAANQITVQSGTIKIYTVRIINSKGQVVLQQQVQNTSAAIDIKHLTAGLYMLQMVTETGVTTEKFMKQ